MIRLSRRGPSVHTARVVVVVAAALVAIGARAQSPDPGIRFEDVAERAGLRRPLAHSPTPHKHLPETMAGGVAVFDYDGDGRLDLYFTNGAALPSLEKSSPEYWNRLYRNAGDLTFTDVTESAGVAGRGYSIGVAAADYDNDGHQDLFVAGVHANLLFRNRGDGRFEEVARAAGIRSDQWSVAAAWLDYDRDGWLDLLVVNYVQWTPAFDRFCGDRVRGLRVYCHPRYFEGTPNALYRNRGDGTFEEVTTRAGIASLVGKGMSVAIADYDQDGWVDAFVTNDTMPNFLLRNTGRGAFEETALLAGAALPAHGRPVSAMGVDFRDLDNDGRPDIFFTALAGETFPLLRNEGSGSFRDVTYASGLGPLTIGRSGWGTVIADLDNDGWKDLFVTTSHVNDRIEQFEATRYREPNAVFRNTGNGRFADASVSAGESFRQVGAWRGSAIGDLDGDGRLDVVTTALGARPALWHNRGATGRHWVAVRLRGTRSSRDGIGAVVRIGTQVNHATTSVGYASSSSPLVHFGLGSEPGPVTLDVTWPSGARQVVRDVAVDQVIEITEPR
jgi:enediyne biosynthesis protein E4